ncbi:MAG: hypothetical protein JSS07_05015 [Proteobacteria bacterium]|nr:hypothetical protein [Pseudomonadota bacterium]
MSLNGSKTNNQAQKQLTEKQNSQSLLIINMLPNDIFGEFFRHILSGEDFKSLAKAKEVCTLWKHYVQEYCLVLINIYFPYRKKENLYEENPLALLYQEWKYYKESFSESIQHAMFNCGKPMKVFYHLSFYQILISEVKNGNSKRIFEVPDKERQLILYALLPTMPEHCSDVDLQLINSYRTQINQSENYFSICCQLSFPIDINLILAALSGNREVIAQVKNKELKITLLALFSSNNHDFLKEISNEDLAIIQLQTLIIATINNQVNIVSTLLPIVITREVDHKSQIQETLLKKAICYNCLDVIKIIAPQTEAITLSKALKYAISDDEVQIVEYLLQLEILFSIQEVKKSNAEYAVKYGSIEIIKLFIKHSAVSQMDALLIAVEHKKTSVLIYLLSSHQYSYENLHSAYEMTVKLLIHPSFRNANHVQAMQKILQAALENTPIIDLSKSTSMPLPMYQNSLTSQNTLNQVPIAAVEQTSKKYPTWCCFV